MLDPIAYCMEKFVISVEIPCYRLVHIAVVVSSLTQRRAVRQQVRVYPVYTDVYTALRLIGTLANAKRRITVSQEKGRPNHNEGRARKPTSYSMQNKRCRLLSVPSGEQATGRRWGCSGLEYPRWNENEMQ